MIDADAGLTPEYSHPRNDMTMNRHFQLRSCAHVAAGLTIAATLNARAQAPALAPSGAAVSEVTVDAAQPGPPISKYIYGQFIEHLGRCIYGGIWAEMLEDRKFYFPVDGEAPAWEMFTDRK